ncbi:uncharacterized protein LOC114793004 [Denticeps clupeoides]|uniref:uncharacterized protein LOC114793004 n=1 Tax=Denticeps clupeoides TaxID=299321 RepID=UPI0010A56D63|nr:uncharacterized protein LOC114793004 [Denticeps clupeoides]
MWQTAAASGSGPCRRAVDEEDEFLSFAKRSREVHRLCDEEVLLPQLPQPRPFPQYDGDFWNRNLQQPRNKGPEIHRFLPNSYFSPPLGHAQVNSLDALQVPMPDPRESSVARVGAEKLPSPADLMGRSRKGRSRVQRSELSKVTTVLQHIGDLRKKQSSIDRLKTEKWRISNNDSGPEESSLSGQEMITEASEPIFSHNVFNTYEKQHSAFLFPHNQQDLFKGFPDQVMTPGDNPMMSFLMATADREILGSKEGPKVSNNEFWGIGWNTEE